MSQPLTTGEQSGIVVAVGAAAFVATTLFIVALAPSEAITVATLFDPDSVPPTEHDHVASTLGRIALLSPMAATAAALATLYGVHPAGYARRRAEHDERTQERAREAAVLRETLTSYARAQQYAPHLLTARDDSAPEPAPSDPTEHAPAGPRPERHDPRGRDPRPLGFADTVFAVAFGILLAFAIIAALFVLGLLSILKALL